MTVWAGGEFDITDADGYFEITGLDPGLTQVIVIPTEFFVPATEEIVQVVIIDGVIIPLGYPNVGPLDDTYWVIDPDAKPPNP
jgi:hypothetical protein